MLDIDIKYPVENSYPPDQQVSMLDLRIQGFREDTEAVVMRSKTDGGALYILLKDSIEGLRWLPLRID